MSIQMNHAGASTVNITTVAGAVNFDEIVTDPGSFGGVYVYDGSTAQSVANGSTPILLTCWAAAGGANGLSNDTTPVAASNKITITRAGKYQVFYSVSFISGKANLNWEFYVYNGGAQMTNTGCLTKTSSNTDSQVVSAMGFMTVAANADIDLRCYHNDGAPQTITVGHANMTVVRVGN
jgi:hypothetical protein